MKKILIALLIIISISTVPTNAYNKKLDLNINEYIKLINVSISELNANLEPIEKANLKTILLNGLNEGYIIPSINNYENLKNEIDILIGNIKDTKVLNKSLQIKHNLLIDELSEITKLIDESINIKKEILNGDIFKLIEDEKKVQNINKKIDLVNTIYNKINNFSIKF